MPARPSRYQPKNILHKWSHWSTIIPAKIKSYPKPFYEEERIELEDSDFLDIYWRRQKKSDKILILCHGLEGSYDRTYNNTSSDYFFERGYNILAWNYRSCGTELNRTKRLYHHVAIDDLEKIISYVLEKSYQEIYLMGFSMGGALILNYLGQSDADIRIKGASAISAPLNIQTAAAALKKFPNVVYMKNFIRTLKPKLLAKAQQFPGELNEAMLSQIKSFDEIDNYFTAPLHGFTDKEDYYTKASPIHTIQHIKVPCLLINAKNDPFLGWDSLDDNLFKQHPFIHFILSDYGGHCGFSVKGTKNAWSEIRTEEFFREIAE